ncbi:MSCRAMM family adhesin SdrC [Pendulispora rubella]|uniref:MSCRAMM family adhesin SdrC n=1 Tax=Pendulispora rubella TaxID=2741070 RepID=A0ABZ2KVN2_9BACT
MRYRFAFAAMLCSSFFLGCASDSDDVADDDAMEAQELTAIEETDAEPDEGEDGIESEPRADVDDNEGADEASIDDPEVAADGSETDDVDGEADLETTGLTTLDLGGKPTGASYMAVVEQKTNRIMVFPESDHTWTGRKPNWSWGANNSPQIPKGQRGRFDNPSDVKLKKNGTVLVAASGGGIAIVRKSDRRATFVAYPGGNPHAIETLPGGHVVIASSEGFLCVYSTKKGASSTCHRTNFAKAHGVVWDSARKRLWVVGGTQLGSYSLNGSTLKLDKAWKIPGNGHDLMPDGKDTLLFSSTHDVYSFDRVAHTYRSLSKTAKIDPKNYIKGIDRHPRTKELIISRDHDLSDKVYGDPLVYRYTASGAKTVFTRTGAQFYKVRWWVAR